MERLIMYLYAVSFKLHEEIKIGVTKNLSQRFSALSSDFGEIVSELIYETSSAFDLEKDLHEYFKRDRIPKENGRGRTEFFKISLQRCQDYLAGVGLKPKPNLTDNDLHSFLGETYRLDRYSATTKLKLHFKKSLQEFPALLEIFEDESFLESLKESSQLILIDCL